MSILFFAILIYSCKTDDDSVNNPLPMINPPEWIKGSWVRNVDSVNTEMFVISENDVILQRTNETTNTTISFIDSCIKNKIQLSEYTKYNTYYNLSFTNENNEVNEIYFAKIADNEIRYLTDHSPTPKTYIRE